ncbi:hypothetical protein [Pseudoalteromonas sp. P1-30]|uniref:hypothetical protein n=1 Tax=Pseudoalteromonas sp. P1-30 TaxID=1723760 RepID=UPI0006D64058|nr:hypothetical protein [Pseudoalteromonas sp. P1-30]
MKELNLHTTQELLTRIRPIEASKYQSVIVLSIFNKRKKSEKLLAALSISRCCERYHCLQLALSCDSTGKKEKKGVKNIDFIHQSLPMTAQATRQHKY